MRNVESVLNENPADNNADADAYFRERIDWALGVLRGYTIALKGMRETTQVFNDKFGNGM